MVKILILLLVSCSCFADGDNEGWLWGSLSRVKSSASRLAGALNPYGENMLFGSVSSVVSRAKKHTEYELSRIADDFWYNSDGFGKAWGLCVGCMFVSGVVVVAGWSAGSWTILPLVRGDIAFTLCKAFLAGFTTCMSGAFIVGSHALAEGSYKVSEYAEAFSVGVARGGARVSDGILDSIMRGQVDNEIIRMRFPGLKRLSSCDLQ